MSPVYYNYRYSTSATFDMVGNSHGPRISPEFSQNKAPNYGMGYGTSGGTGAGGYYIDENTFGTTGGWVPGGTDPHKFGYWASSASRPTWVSPAPSNLHFNSSSVNNDEGTGTVMTSARFAGLCFTSGCHSSSGIQSTWAGHIVVPGQSGSWVNMFNRPYMMEMQTVGRGGSVASNGNWGDLSAAASGFHTGNDAGYKWGYPPNDPTAAQSGYHQFPCSKCHTPHATVLPRLMATNCLDIGSGGQYIKHGTGTLFAFPEYFALKKGASLWSSDNYTEQNISTTLMSDVDAWRMSVTCHADRDGPGNTSPVEGGALDGNGLTSGSTGTRGWNRVTPW